MRVVDAVFCLVDKHERRRGIAYGIDMPPDQLRLAGSPVPASPHRVAARAGDAGGATVEYLDLGLVVGAAVEPHLPVIVQLVKQALPDAGVVKVVGGAVVADPGVGGVAPDAVFVVGVVGRHAAVVVVDVHLPAKLQLLDVAEASGGQTARLGPAQRGQQQRRENGDDGNHDQQLNEGEGRLAVEGTGTPRLFARWIGQLGFAEAWRRWGLCQMQK